jgi:hypothetical protein
MQQRQELEKTNLSARSTNTAARHVSNFETRWRPILDSLELLKKAGDHISEVSSRSPQPSHPFTIFLGAPIRKVSLEYHHLYSNGLSS